MPNINLKQKILAGFTVFVLFFLIGSLFYFISLDNKHKTELLRERVLKNKAEKEMTEKLSRVRIASSTLPNISAEAYLTMAITKTGQKKVLQQKNPDFALPIASITKLMVALVALENAKPETTLKATRDYIGLEESAFVLETDKVYTLKELLANMLIASDNDSARLIGSLLGTDNFVAKMNARAQALNLTKTHFVNITGLDPAKPFLEVNISSPNDLASLLLYIKNNRPEILKPTTNFQYNFCAIDGYCKMATNTDKLLGREDFKLRILGGKTGSTDLAGKNLALMAEIEPGITLINIVLGAKDNFADTVSLINNVMVN